MCCCKNSRLDWITRKEIETRTSKKKTYLCFAEIKITFIKKINPWSVSNDSKFSRYLAHRWQKLERSFNSTTNTRNVPVSLHNLQTLRFKTWDMCIRRKLFSEKLWSFGLILYSVTRIVIDYTIDIFFRSVHIFSAQFRHLIENCI